MGGEKRINQESLPIKGTGLENGRRGKAAPKKPLGRQGTLYPKVRPKRRKLTEKKKLYGPKRRGQKKQKARTGKRNGKIVKIQKECTKGTL